ncbi:hypothetical protein DVH24_012574 [Malus domestica]|uniref:peptidylprolyl isomerase n=1 Tax=Malus domestica TaxID=3750 RepID=A0A498HQ66_MALDO|nr:hypothetical protein DVH24_012574 [Malus domestica]
MEVEKGTNLSDIENDLDEEPGEVIESAPPLEVGEERELGSSGIKKKLLKRGHGYEAPEFGDEATEKTDCGNLDLVHYVGTLLDGTKIESTRDGDDPLTIKLGEGRVVKGLDYAVVTMKKGEIALFTLPAELGYDNAAVRFEVELVSWIRVVDLSRDGGIVKKIVEKGERNELPGDLDEVFVKYRAALADGTVVAETPEEGIEFYVKDGHFCPALPKAIKTMKRGEKAKLIVQPRYAFGEEGRDANEGFNSIPPSDAKVLKKILKEGEGAWTANEGASVTVSYIARLEDGTVFDKKGVDGEQPLEFIIDEEQVIAGLDRAVATMKKGELAILTIHPDFGFGSVEVRRDLAVVPPCSNVFFEVEMLDFIREKAPWEMSNQERLEAAGKKKEEGNLLFKKGKLQQAGKKYDKAADYVSEDGNFGDDESKLARTLRMLCWLNGAACSLKLNDFQEAIKLCSKVLDIEFHNVKALYRRAQAYMEIADLVLAELDIKKALEVDPHNREVKLIEKNLKRLQVESDKRDAKLYTNIFGRATKLLLLLLLLLPLSNVCSQMLPVSHSQLVKFLPGFQGPLPFELETGYVGVGEEEEVQLFYYFVKTERKPEEAPLMLWLTGGPGCSSLTALLYEIGPLNFNIEQYNGSLPTLTLNPYAWTKVSSIIFVDSPVGTGFSYARSSFASPPSDSEQVGHALQFLRKWLVDHPEFMSNPFFVGGDSYSGIPVPVLAQLISDGNQEGVRPAINLQGYILGNPVTVPQDEGNSQITFAHGMGLIPDDLFESKIHIMQSLERSCGGEYQTIDPRNAECLKHKQAYHTCISQINLAHILEWNCELVSPKPPLHMLDKRRYLSNKDYNVFSESTPPPILDCRSYGYLLSEYWTNDQYVREALHIRKGSIGRWQRCSYDIPYEYDIHTSIQFHAKFSAQGYYRSLIYSGDHDMLVPFMATQAWIRSLNYSIVNDWRPWFVKGQVAGYGAGHTAPEYKPEECSTMYTKWLYEEPL